jgi:hypothetical protein
MHECDYCWARKGIRRSFHDQGALKRHIGGSAECREARKAATANKLRIQLGVGPNVDEPGTSVPEDVEMLDMDVDPMPVPEILPIPGLAPELDARADAQDAPEGVPPAQDNASPRSTGGQATGNQRYVHIEEVPDEDELRPGMTFGATSTQFEDIQEAQEQNQESQYGPFLNREVWEVAEFMVDCLGKSEADRFLKLPCVHLHHNHELSPFAYLNCPIRFRKVQI